MRWDQHGWDTYGPSPHVRRDDGCRCDRQDRRRGLDELRPGAGNIDTRRRSCSARRPGRRFRPNGGPTPSDAAVYAVHDRATPLRSSIARRVLAKTQPLYGGSLKTSALRAPNAPQSYFASEQIVDELAHAANMDPIAFRRLNIDGTNVLGARWLSVLDAATIAAGWKPKVAASNLQTGDVVTGRGFGFGTFASSQVGLVADIDGEQEDRQDRREARVDRPEQRDHGQPGGRRQPDERCADPGPLPGDVRSRPRGTRSGSRASTGSRIRSSASRTRRRSR